jgi:hypothetical protein
MLVHDGVLDPERTIQIGIRGSAEMLYEFSYTSGMTVIHAEEIDSLGLQAVIAKARSVIEHGSDRRKQLLAVCVQSTNGKAVNERENQARASVEYDKGLTELENQYAAAEKEIGKSEMDVEEEVQGGRGRW